jgi:hypothetical protein
VIEGRCGTCDVVTDTLPCPFCTRAGGDLIEHEVSEDCVCGPTPQPVKRDDGSVGWVIVHHSLDGREANK